MKFLLAFGLFTILPFFAKAQDFPSELWHDGFLVLVSEDTLSGKIKYDLDHDLVQIETAKKTFTYSAQKLFYFQIFDQTVDAYRQFYTLPYAMVGKYVTPVIFEVVVEGKMTLLAREEIEVTTVRDTYNPPYAVTPNFSYDKKKLVYTYYFLDDKGSITKYSNKKRDLLHILRQRGSKVNEYMKINHLRADKRIDLIRIVSFYNGII